MESSYWPIEQLPGLSQEQQAQLQDLGITNTKQLLAFANKTHKKHALALQMQIHLQYVNKWVALADLARIPSVGDRYCGLLLHSGIASVVQLAQTPIYRLHRQILRLYVATLQRNDLCPPVEVVQKWIAEAKMLV